MPVKPAFMIHTGDISHLSKVSEFDDADRIISQTRLDVHYVPGEHDFLDEEQKLYRECYGRGTKGAGWYSFDAAACTLSVSSTSSISRPAGSAILGDEQLAWLEADVKRRSASTPIVVFAHIPLWTVYPEWGWGTEDGGRALELLKRFGSVTVLNGHIHQVMQKVEGNVIVPHRPLNCVSATGPRHCSFARTHESRRRQAPHAPWHRERHLQTRLRTTRDRRHAVAELRSTRQWEPQ